ncbi:GNAT family N-acetyltransferase [Bradyrhizobium iriomotense]|nr:GNAT family N-acetyltransferase [Bradyrhizobium iriomotense]
METQDLPAVIGIADRVHLNYPEEEAVFAERQHLYPGGCFVLHAGPAEITGYIVSHPWHFKQPPVLNVLLERLPDPASTFYVHDIALLPETRGNGVASDVVRKLITHAKEAGFPNISLVAVNDSTAFWERHGFRTLEDDALNKKLATYDEHARYMVLGLRKRRQFT